MTQELDGRFAPAMPLAKQSVRAVALIGMAHRASILVWLPQLCHAVCNQRTSEDHSFAMTVKREQELWALALWVEREFGEDGESFIAERVLHFELKAEEGGKHLWLNVARRFVQLRSERATQRN